MRGRHLGWKSADPAKMGTGSNPKFHCYVHDKLTYDEHTTRLYV